MKRLNTKELEKLALAFVWDYCNKNHIAIIHTPSEPANISQHQAVYSTGKIQPTGNMSGVLLDNQIDFTFHNMPEKIKGEGNTYIFRCSVNYLFSFKTGSFDWKKLDFVSVVYIVGKMYKYKHYFEASTYDKINETWSSE